MPVVELSLEVAAYEHDGPVYLRLGTNKEKEIYNNEYAFQIGKAVTLKDGNDITLIGAGSILKDILDASFQLDAEGIGARVIDMHTIKPIDKEIIIRAIDETGTIMTIEDHNIIGGIGSTVAEVIAESGMPVKFIRLGLKDQFSRGYGSYDDVKEMNGVGIGNIREAVRKLLA